MSRESDQIQQQIQSNPELMAALRRVGLAQQSATARNGGNFWRNNEDPEVMQASQEFERLMQANGITMPHDYHMMPDGRLVRDDFIERNPWFVPTVIGSVITGGALAPESAGGMGLLSGGAAGGSAGGTTAASEGGMTGLAGSSYTVPSATLGEAGGIGGTTAAMAGKPSLGKRLFNALVGDSAEERLQTGLNLAGNILQSRQTSKAVDAQVAAANRALDLQRDIYLQQRSDLMPYADMGRGAIGDMGRMTGTTPVSAPTLASLSQPSGPSSSGITGERGAPPPHDGNPNNAPVTGQAVPRAGSLSTLGSAGMVNMVSPDGRPARVPQNQVQAALQAGGRLA